MTDQSQSGLGRSRLPSLSRGQIEEGEEYQPPLGLLVVKRSPSEPLKGSWDHHCVVDYTAQNPAMRYCDYGWDGGRH